MRTLKKGSSGPDVKAMQEILNSCGFPCGTADGIFGANTEKAVRAFQAANGLTADGIAGEQTLTTLAIVKATVQGDPVDVEEKHEGDGYTEHAEAVSIPADSMIITRDEYRTLKAAIVAAYAVIKKYE
jgi:peptidoglycan hydrolase-like protein with peptidoglycan-binding domain